MPLVLLDSFNGSIHSFQAIVSLWPLAKANSRQETQVKIFIGDKDFFFKEYWSLQLLYYHVPCNILFFPFYISKLYLYK